MRETEAIAQDGRVHHLRLGCGNHPLALHAGKASLHRDREHVSSGQGRLKRAAQIGMGCKAQTADGSDCSIAAHQGLEGLATPQAALRPLFLHLRTGFEQVPRALRAPIRRPALPFIRPQCVALRHGFAPLFGA